MIFFPNLSHIGIVIINVKSFEFINAVSKDFNIFSEQYYMHVDPALDVLATTTFSEKYDPWIKGVIIPVVWKKKYGKGKIFYNSIGHSKQDYNIPEVWTLIKRGVIWATK